MDNRKGSCRDLRLTGAWVVGHDRLTEVRAGPSLHPMNASWSRTRLRPSRPLIGGPFGSAGRYYRPMVIGRRSPNDYWPPRLTITAAKTSTTTPTLNATAGASTSATFATAITVGSHPCQTRYSTGRLGTISATFSIRSRVASPLMTASQRAPIRHFEVLRLLYRLLLEDRPMAIKRPRITRALRTVDAVKAARLVLRLSHRNAGGREPFCDLHDGRPEIDRITFPVRANRQAIS